jgi:hypothetical protein
MKVVLRLLAYLVAAMLAVAIVVAVMSSVLNQTVLNSSYLENKAVQTNSYSQLSTAIINEIIQHGNITDPDARAKLQQIITPALLQQKISSALNQLQAYYKGHGQIPTIDLTSFVAQVQAAGLPVPSNSAIDKPITFGNNGKAQNISNKFEMVRTDSLIAVVVLVLVLIGLSWERHRYAVLPDIAIISGLLLGIFAVAFGVAPHVISKYAKFNTGSNAFTTVAQNFAYSIAHDLATIIGIVAAVLFVGGIISRILLAKMKPKKPAAQTFKPMAKKSVSAAR